jgi:hypothetical protein
LPVDASFTHRKPAAMACLKGNGAARGMPAALILLAMCMCGIMGQSEQFMQWEQIELAPISPSCRALMTLTNVFTNGTAGSANCSTLVLFGGFNFPQDPVIGGGPLIYRDELSVFHSNIRRWVTFDISNPTARAGHIALPGSSSAPGIITNNLDYQVVLHGGMNGQVVFNDTWILSFNFNLCEPPMVVTQQGQSALAQWTQLQVNSPTVPSPRWGHAGAFWNSSLVIFGGFSTPLRACDASLSIISNSHTHTLSLCLCVCVCLSLCVSL